MGKTPEESALAVVECIGWGVGRVLRSEWRSPNVKLLMLLAFWTFVVLNAFYPLVRFGRPVLNYAFFSAASLTPLWMMVVACGADGRRELVVKFLIACLFVPAFLFSATGAGCGMEVRDGVDLSQERIRSERFPGGNIAVYRLNGGATTSFAILVRQECKIFPGISVVRAIVTKYGTKVTLEPVGDGSIRARFPAYNVDGESVENFRLRRGCWGPDI